MKKAVACLEILAVSIGNESKERELGTSKAKPSNSPVSIHALSLATRTSAWCPISLSSGVFNLLQPSIQGIGFHGFGGSLDGTHGVGFI